MAGIKDSKEIIIALGLIRKEVIKAKADGKLDFKDVVAFVTHLQSDPAFAAALMAGLDNLSGVMAEGADLQWAEVIELVQTAIEALKD